MPGSQEGIMKSIRPYKSSEQYLYAMKEDLAEWLKDLYGLDIEAASFLDRLETGVLLCHHANAATQLARDLGREYPGLSRAVRLPAHGVACNHLAQAGTFQARDNVSNFIQWCRQEMAIQDVLMFETEDLVLRKNEKSVVLCLLEVARRGSRFGVRAPTLVQMEEEIEEEMREDLQLPREAAPLPRPPRKAPDLRNVDRMVQHFVSRCTCPVQFSMVKVSEGKYRVGDSSTLIFVRILRKHVMVRVGGGWDTLEHYLDKHDPCRCTSLSHKQALKMAGSPRAPPAQVQHEIAARLTAPGADHHPDRPQPALLVRRSQSPLPSVEWGSYVAHGPGRRVPPSPGLGREGRPSHRDPSEPRAAAFARGRGQPATPSRRPSAAEEGPGSDKTSSNRPRATVCGSISSQRDGNAGNPTPRSENVPPESRPGATAGNGRATPHPWGRGIQSGFSSSAACQNQPGEKAPFPGTVGQNGRPPREQSLRPATPIRPSGEVPPSFRKAPGLVTSLEALLEEAPAEGQRKAPQAGRSASPVKPTAPKEDGDTKAPGTVRLAVYRPPTPRRSRGGSLDLRNGGSPMFQNQDPPGGSGPPPKEEGKTSRSLAKTAKVGLNPLDLGQPREATQPFREPGGTPNRPWKGDQRGPGDPEQERVYTPLPLDPAEEQAVYRSLEEEIMANVKELGDQKEGKGSRWRGFETGPGVGGEATVLAYRGLQLAPTPTLPFWAGAKGTPGVPRSGVYVPEGEARWPPAGPGYEAVVRELSAALGRQRLAAGAPRGPPGPSSSSSSDGGAPGPKRTVLGGGPAREEEEEKHGASEAGDGLATSATPAEGGLNGDAPSEPAGPAESTAPSGDGGHPPPPPSQPRRALRKPDRVPSIYKLKLRPRIRPRRDHRLGKKPSKIPVPTAYRRLRRTPSLRGQPKAPASSTPTPTREKGPPDPKVEGRAGLCPREERTAAEGGGGVSDDEESWV